MEKLLCFRSSAVTRLNRIHTSPTIPKEPLLKFGSGAIDAEECSVPLTPSNLPKTSESEDALASTLTQTPLSATTVDLDQLKNDAEVSSKAKILPFQKVDLSFGCATPPKLCDAKASAKSVNVELMDGLPNVEDAGCHLDISEISALAKTSTTRKIHSAKVSNSPTLKSCDTYSEASESSTGAFEWVTPDFQELVALLISSYEMSSGSGVEFASGNYFYEIDEALAEDTIEELISREKRHILAFVYNSGLDSSHKVCKTMLQLSEYLLSTCYFLCKALGNERETNKNAKQQPTIKQSCKSLKIRLKIEAGYFSQSKQSMQAIIEAFEVKCTQLRDHLEEAEEKLVQADGLIRQYNDIIEKEKQANDDLKQKLHEEASKNSNIQRVKICNEELTAQLNSRNKELALLRERLGIFEESSKQESLVGQKISDMTVSLNEMISEASFISEKLSSSFEREQNEKNMLVDIDKESMLIQQEKDKSLKSEEQLQPNQFVQRKICACCSRKYYDSKKPKTTSQKIYKHSRGSNRIKSIERLQNYRFCSASQGQPLMFHLGKKSSSHSQEVQTEKSDYKSFYCLSTLFIFLFVDVFVFNATIIKLAANLLLITWFLLSVQVVRFLHFVSSSKYLQSILDTFSILLIHFIHLVRNILHLKLFTFG